ncbi:MAG: hypothetical protein B6U97_02130 [Candidatus Altiarchaeales archaeon ex4484_96]|nr:MAG: hypothetical protein B6U97_02130 [Candidatus Altiarchaeales archaeon ex4484_96]
MIKNNGCRMGQVSMEVIILLAVIMILFSMVMVQVSSKNNQIRLRGELYKKKIVCHQVANAISALYVAGPLSRVNVSLSYGYNVTVYPQSGYISVGDDAGVVGCCMPSGLMNHSVSFNSSTLKLVNLNNLVVYLNE